MFRRKLTFYKKYSFMGSTVYFYIMNFVKTFTHSFIYLKNMEMFLNDH